MKKVLGISKKLLHRQSPCLREGAGKAYSSPACLWEGAGEAYMAPSYFQCKDTHGYGANIDGNFTQLPLWSPQLSQISNMCQGAYMS